MRFVTALARFTLTPLLLLAATAQATLDEKAALRSSQAAIGRQLGDYAFRDSQGRDVRLAQLRGQPLVVNFIYTGCFQVCPTTTKALALSVAAAERTVGPGKFRVATIGFNLPFDTPQAMKQFAKQQGISASNWLFLTPDAQTLPQLLTAFKEYEMVALGAIMMGTMIFMPKGLVPSLALLAASARAGKAPA